MLPYPKAILLKSAATYYHFPIETWNNYDIISLRLHSRFFPTSNGKRKESFLNITLLDTSIDIALEIKRWQEFFFLALFLLSNFIFIHHVTHLPSLSFPSHALFAAYLKSTTKTEEEEKLFGSRSGMGLFKIQTLLEGSYAKLSQLSKCLPIC